MTTHRVVIPDDAELWRRYRRGTLSLCAISQDRGTRHVRNQLVKRGWSFARRGKGAYTVHEAPCSSCGAPFVADGQRLRLCAHCRPRVDPVWWQQYEAARLEAAARREARYAAVHAAVLARHWPKPTVIDKIRALAIQDY